MGVVINCSELNLDHYSIDLLTNDGEKQVIDASPYVRALSLTYASLRAPCGFSLTVLRDSVFVPAIQLSKSSICLRTSGTKR